MLQSHNVYTKSIESLWSGLKIEMGGGGGGGWRDTQTQCWYRKPNYVFLFGEEIRLKINLIFILNVAVIRLV